MVRISRAQGISLPPAMLDELRQEAADKGISLSAVVRGYILAGRLHHGGGGLVDLKREANSDNRHQ